MSKFNKYFYIYMIYQLIIIPLYLTKIAINNNELYSKISIISFAMLSMIFMIFMNGNIFNRLLGLSLIILPFIYLIIILLLFYKNDFNRDNYSDNETNITKIILFSYMLLVFILYLTFLWLKARSQF